MAGKVAYMPNVSTGGEDPAQRPSRGDGRLLARRYRLLTVVGHGGMGTVWHAHDEVLGRDVAVKEVILPLGLGPDEREIHHKRTFREARTAARLAHPSVVTVFDVVEEDGRPWIIMELIKAPSLDQVIKDNGRLPPRRAGQIARQMLGALHTAHEAGVLHRDVKPSNVLVARGDRVVLTDFGIATAAGDVTLTQTGLVMGSPAYIAPERARGRTAGPASDLWALGITLYAMVEGGASPYERSEPMASLIAVISEEPDPPAHAGPLRPIIDGLLRKDPAERLSALDAAAMLDQVVRGLALTRRSTLPMTPVPDQGPATRRFDAAKDAEGPPEGGSAADSSAAGPAGPAKPRDEGGGAADARSAAAATTAVDAPGSYADSPADTPTDPSVQPPTESAAESPAGPVESAAAGTGVSTEGRDGDSAGTDDLAGPDAGTDADADADAAEPAGPPGQAGQAGEGEDARTAVPAAAPTVAGPTAVAPAATGPAIDPTTAAARPALGSTAPAGGPAGAVRRSAWGRTTLVIIAIALVAILILSVWAWVSRGEEKKSPGATRRSHPPTSTPASTPASTPGSAGTRPASPGVAPGFRGYTDPTGFSIAVPADWSGPERRSASVFFYAPGRRSYIQIDQTDNPNPSALGDWKSQERGASGRFSNYRRIKLGPTGDQPPVPDTGDGSKSADWEFTWDSGSAKKHVLDRGFVTSGHGYAILVSAPDAGWPATIARLQQVYTSFRPAK